MNRKPYVVYSFNCQSTCLMQVVHTHASVFNKQYILVSVKGGDALKLVR